MADYSVTSDTALILMQLIYGKNADARLTGGIRTFKSNTTTS
jgi:hypothetical protein